MKEQSYQKLAQHLDQLPGGFAPSDTGAELRLLQELFTPEEAELAVHLTLDRENVPVIAARANLSPVEAERRLDEMSHKGLVFSIQSEDGLTLYQAAPFIVGIFEFQVNNLDGAFLGALAEYWGAQKQRPRPQTIPQTRTIPVGQSVELHQEILAYEQIGELIAAQDRFAVAPCICRRHTSLAGEGCDAPEETCLMFGDWADYYVRCDRGRSIDRAEVMEILAQADAANLVLQPSNSRDIAFLCCCCGCCCGILNRFQSHPRPSEIVANPFIAQYESEVCLGCGVCLERCQMQALAEADDLVTLNADRCIGCGLCVSTCPSGALTLARKPDRERPQPPATLDDAWRIISRDQAQVH